MKITKFITKKQNGILSAALVISISSAVNALLGFLKSRLLANYFGVSNELAIFYTADRIPNLIYSILVVGAISTVFIPTFTQNLKQSKQKAFESASSIITTTLILFLILSISVFLFSYQIIKILTLNKFSYDQIVLGSNLMRIMIISQVLLVISSLITSILQSFKYFLIPAIAPVLYNIGMIFGIILLSNKFGIYGPAYGVAFGAFLNLIVQIPLLKKTQFKYNFNINLNDKSLKQMMVLVPPRILSVSMSNIVATINNSLAILISTSSVVHLKFATQLQTFPVSLFGLSMAQALLPTLSKEADPSDREKFKQTLITTLHQTMFLVIPLSVIFLILRVPIVRIVYGVSNFPWESTVKTSYALAFFSLSIFAQSANYILSRGFYALKDTKTPVLINLFTIFLNILLTMFFVLYLKLGVWSIAFSYTITTILDMLLYFIFLNKKVNQFNVQEILVPFSKISASAVLMGISLYVPLKILDQYIFDTQYTIQLIILTIIAGSIGMAVYLLLTKLFNVQEINLFYKLLKKLHILNTQLPQTEKDL